MFYTFEELRQKAKENLSSLFGTASYGEREVTKYSDEYCCNDWSSNLEFKTSNIDTALNFLFPE